jgi:general secretion pathway protein G
MKRIVLIIVALGVLTLILKISLSVPNEELAKIKVARYEVQLIANDVRSFKTENGFLPAEKNWFGALLDNRPNDGDLDKLQVLDGFPHDPWGERYQYMLSEGNTEKFDIVSFGADRSPGGTGADSDISSTALMAQTP